MISRHVVYARPQSAAMALANLLRHGYKASPSRCRVRVSHARRREAVPRLPFLGRTVGTKFAAAAVKAA